LLYESEKSNTEYPCTVIVLLVLTGRLQRGGEERGRKIIPFGNGICGQRKIPRQRNVIIANAESLNRPCETVASSPKVNHSVFEPFLASGCPRCSLNAKTA
jgi:hypothetical protein